MAILNMPGLRFALRALQYRNYRLYFGGQSFSLIGTWMQQLALGWLAGRTVVGYISAYDHWVAFALLAFIGGRMIWESFHEKDESARDITRWWTLLVLSVATSIDSLGAGLSYAFLNVKILMAAVTTGLTTFVITIAGHAIGKKVGPYVERWADIIGGIILIFIGVRILITHLF